MKAVGSLTISLDTELAWGRIDAEELKDFLPLLKRTRTVIDQLLELFEQYNVPVTWALVGRMIDTESCKASELIPPLSKYFDGGLAEQRYADPKLNTAGNSFLSYPEIVEKIKLSKVGHELGTHSFNHFFFNELQDKALVMADFKAMEKVAAHHGFSQTSMVFPKNQVDHLDVAVGFGVKVVRGPDQVWYGGLPGFLGKIVRQADYALPLPASCVVPEMCGNGLVSLPGSMVFRREHRGPKRFLPMQLLSAKAIGGLRMAVKQKKAVHLWFHPFNFAYKQAAHFKELEKVLVYAEKQRKKDMLEIRTMGDYAGLKL